jgi:hypothetical protein
MKRSIVVLLLLVLRIVGSSAQARTSLPPEQSHFSAENEGVKSPVRIPDSAWAILKADERVKNVLADENLSADQLPRSWFSAAVVHLHSADEKDIFVAAEGELMGANISPFWLFLDTPQGMKLVLQTSAHDEIIRPERWHGYRVVELVGMTCCEISRTWLRYQNGQYRNYRKTTEDIK